MSKKTFRKKFLDLIMTERNLEEINSVISGDIPMNSEISGDIPIIIKKQIKASFNLPTDDCDIILKLYEENNQLKQQIEKMKCCENCKHFIKDFESTIFTTLSCEVKNCNDNDEWELAE